MSVDISHFITEPLLPPIYWRGAGGSIALWPGIMGPLLHTRRSSLGSTIIELQTFFPFVSHSKDWWLHAFSPDYPVVVIVSRGKAVLPAHSRRLLVSSFLALGVGALVVGEKE